MTDLEKLVEQWARETGFVDASNDLNSPPCWWAAGHNDRWEKFARLAMAHAAEEAAKVCVEIKRAGYGGYAPPEHGAAAEYYEEGCGDCADAIREKFSIK